MCTAYFIIIFQLRAAILSSRPIYLLFDTGNVDLLYGKRGMYMRAIPTSSITSKSRHSITLIGLRMRLASPKLEMLNADRRLDISAMSADMRLQNRQVLNFSNLFGNKFVI